MPGKRGSHLRDRVLYEELLNEGASKKQAARIANAVAKSSAKNAGHLGGTAADYEDWTVGELRERAKELGLTGYSGKRKAELIAMIRND